MPVEVGLVGPAVCAIGGGWFRLHPAALNVASNATTAANRQSGARGAERDTFIKIYFPWRVKIIDVRQRMRQPTPAPMPRLWKI
jgi:hypothetical protein